MNDKNRAPTVDYSYWFIIAKMTKGVLVVRGISRKKMVRVSGVTAGKIETAGFKQSYYVMYKSWERRVKQFNVGPVASNFLLPVKAASHYPSD